METEYNDSLLLAIQENMEVLQRIELRNSALNRAQKYQVTLKNY
jgi:hypothetical protein